MSVSRELWIEAFSNRFHPLSYLCRLCSRNLNIPVVSGRRRIDITPESGRDPAKSRSVAFHLSRVCHG
jgi:hypothetical protein